MLDGLLLFGNGFLQVITFLSHLESIVQNCNLYIVLSFFHSLEQVHSDEFTVMFLKMLKPLVFRELDELLGLNKVKIVFVLPVTCPFPDFLPTFHLFVPNGSDRSF